MEDGSIINGMNSFNHYSYGAIGDWLYRSAVGIRESSPGYKRIIIKPHTGGDLKKMQAHTMTPYGKVAVEWSADDNTQTMMRTEIEKLHLIVLFLFYIQQKKKRAMRHLDRWRLLLSR